MRDASSSVRVRSGAPAFSSRFSATHTSAGTELASRDEMTDSVVASSNVSATLPSMRARRLSSSFFAYARPAARAAPAHSAKFASKTPEKRTGS